LASESSWVCSSRIADPEFLHALYELVLECIGDGFRHDEAFRGNARLPVVLNSGIHCRGDGRVLGPRRISNKTDRCLRAPSTTFLIRHGRGDSDFDASLLAARECGRCNSRVVQDRIHLRRSDQESLQHSFRNPRDEQSLQSLERTGEHSRHVSAARHYPPSAPAHKPGRPARTENSKASPRARSPEAGSERNCASLPSRPLRPPGNVPHSPHSSGNRSRISTPPRRGPKRFSHLQGHQARAFVFFFFQDLGGTQHHPCTIGKLSSAMRLKCRTGELDLLFDLDGERASKLFSNSPVAGFVVAIAIVEPLDLST